MVVAGGHHLYGFKITKVKDINRLIDLNILTGVKIADFYVDNLDLDRFHLLSNDKLTEFIIQLKTKVQQLDHVPIDNFLVKVELYLKYQNENKLDIKKNNVLIQNISDELNGLIEKCDKAQCENMFNLFYSKLSVEASYYLTITPHEARWTEYEGGELYFGVGQHISFGSGVDPWKTKLDVTLLDKLVKNNIFFKDKEVDYHFIPDDCNCCS